MMTIGSDNIVPPNDDSLSAIVKDLLEFTENAIRTVSKGGDPWEPLDVLNVFKERAERMYMWTCYDDAKKLRVDRDDAIRDYLKDHDQVVFDGSVHVHQHRVSDPPNLVSTTTLKVDTWRGQQ